MSKQEYQEAYSALRLLMREIGLGHDRRFKGRKSAEKILVRQPVDVQKMLNKTWNLAQEYKAEQVMGERYWFHCPAYATAMYRFKHERKNEVNYAKRRT